MTSRGRGRQKVSGGVNLVSDHLDRQASPCERSHEALHMPEQDVRKDRQTPERPESQRDLEVGESKRRKRGREAERTDGSREERWGGGAWRKVGGWEART